jgi:hypothetical protein
MQERFETKSKSNLLKEIEDILADATQSELSSIKECIMNRNSMRTEKTQMEELGSTQSNVSTTMLNQNLDRVPSGKTIDSRSKSTFQPRPLINSDKEEAQLSSNQSRPLINDDEEEAKLSSNQSIASNEKGGTLLSTTGQPSTLINGDEEEAQLPSHQSRPLINDDEEEANLSSNQSIASSEKGGTLLSTMDQPSTLINGDEEEAQLPSHQSTKSSDKGEARLSPHQ